VNGCEKYKIVSKRLDRIYGSPGFAASCETLSNFKKLKLPMLPLLLPGLERFKGLAILVCVTLESHSEKPVIDYSQIKGAAMNQSQCKVDHQNTKGNFGIQSEGKIGSRQFVANDSCSSQ
jgi:hypothetical protein